MSHNLKFEIFYRDPDLHNLTNSVIIEADNAGDAVLEFTENYVDEGGDHFEIEVVKAL